MFRLRSMHIIFSLSRHIATQSQWLLPEFCRTWKQIYTETVKFSITLLIITKRLWSLTMNITDSYRNISDIWIQVQRIAKHRLRGKWKSETECSMPCVNLEDKDALQQNTVLISIRGHLFKNLSTLLENEAFSYFDKHENTIWRNDLLSI